MSLDTGFKLNRGKGKTSQNLSLPQNIVNLSSYKLNQNEISVLDKGLKFVPTPVHNSKGILNSAVSKFSRQIKLKFHFRNSNSYFKRPFTPKSEWDPPETKIFPEILNTVNNINSEISELSIPKETKNISKQEYQAIQNLSKNQDIIIKPADKGSAVVILDKIDYVKEGYRQLKNEKHYKKIENFLYPETSRKVSEILLSLKNRGDIDEKQFDFLKPPPQIRPRRLYFLPKIHKPKSKWTHNGKIPPGRPIVSDCGSESYEVSKYIDHFLKPLANKHPSYIKNTPDFLTQLGKVTIKPDSLLITLDVESMFTNIDNKTGKIAVKEAFEKSPSGNRPDKEILELLDLCLSRNDFEFNGKKFLQTSGTSMGKTFAPNYCNIFMAKWESEALNKAPHKPTFFKRYLDDIFLIWDHGIEKFWQFFNILNNHHPSIKLVPTIHDKSIDFLDITVFKGPKLEESQKLDTKVFFKPTDTHQLLHKKSFHPKHTFSGIIKSQILRFRNICSQKQDFEQACKVLFRALKTRGYSPRFLRSIKNKTVATLDSTSNQTFGCVCMEDGGSKPCYKFRCVVCNFVETTDMYYSKSLKTFYPINAAMDCRSKNVIYLIECNSCSMQYIGETKRTFAIRANQHRRDIENNNPTSVGSHFNDRGMLGQKGICDLDDFRIYPIIQCPQLDTEEETDKNRKLKTT